MGARTPTSVRPAAAFGQGQAPPPSRPRAALYLLPDDHEQAKAALASLEGFTHAQGYAIVGRYLEPPEGGRPRQKLGRLVQRARTKAFDVVCVLRLDDLASTRVAAVGIALQLAEAGARVVSANEPELAFEGPAVRWIADGERRRSKNVADALKARRARGERVGEIPFGFRLAVDCVHQEPDELEQAVIKEVVALSQTDASFSSIARTLTSRGYRSRAGTPFTHRQIARMLGGAQVAVSAHGEDSFRSGAGPGS
jgi:DNA invertase Pin-like site-specific DNA recombinase